MFWLVGEILCFYMVASSGGNTINIQAKIHMFMIDIGWSNPDDCCQQTPVKISQ
jgi:hypothetical protein